MGLDKEICIRLINNIGFDDGPLNIAVSKFLSADTINISYDDGASEQCSLWCAHSPLMDISVVYDCPNYIIQIISGNEEIAIDFDIDDDDGCSFIRRVGDTYLPLSMVQKLSLLLSVEALTEKGVEWVAHPDPKKQLDKICGLLDVAPFL